MSLNNIAVQNYIGQNAAGDFAKLDPTIFANLNLAAVDRSTASTPFYLSSRIVNASMPIPTCVTTPCFTVLGGQAVADITLPMSFSRNAAPDGDYPITKIGIAPLDADGAPVDSVGTTGAGTCNNTTVAACYDLNTIDATAVNNRALVATTHFRYGITNITNGYGSELLGLSLPINLQYWNGSTYVSSADDVGTIIAIALSNYQLPLTSGSTIATLTQPTLGVGQVNLSAPGAGKNGSVDVTVTSPAYLPSAGGRATFGVYRNNNSIIYMRENY
jgi:MSHA biogenesis protein MshQ